mmetsp:Transcript_21296/g.38555  ORF Transcript_21296/g.38555 Transcript_21296/m.38555 type:complete len:80 (+) Transcript_21296:227-466(+)
MVHPIGSRPLHKQSIIIVRRHPASSSHSAAAPPHPNHSMPQHVVTVLRPAPMTRSNTTVHFSPAKSGSAVLPYRLVADA